MDGFIEGRFEAWGLRLRLALEAGDEIWVRDEHLWRNLARHEHLSFAMRQVSSKPFATRQISKREAGSTFELRVGAPMGDRPAARDPWGGNVDMADKGEQQARVPPRWFVRLAWYIHRGLYRVTGGRIGLWLPRGNRWGTMRLTTTGRRTGQQRSVILGYIEDGPNLVTMAMNGWADAEPAWWLNLQAIPHRERRPRQWPAPGERSSGSGRGTVAALGPVARN